MLHKVDCVFRSAPIVTSTRASAPDNNAEMLLRSLRRIRSRREAIVSEWAPAMLTEMARMSREDGLASHIHPDSVRNHHPKLFERYGRDIGADIPRAANYVDALHPLLDQFGNEFSLTIIHFTLDESTYSSELAPLAGHYPCLRLGPAWWFHDSPEGMMRFRVHATDTAGFRNTVGFNDDTRAFLALSLRYSNRLRIASL